MFHYLVYLSTATQLFSEDILQSILESSRRNNVLKNITGLLLYHDGAILQVLEGDAVSVKQLYQLLELDHRHRSVIKVMEGDSPVRYFEEWSAVEGYLPISRSLISDPASIARTDRVEMLSFLRSFYTANFER